MRKTFLLIFASIFLSACSHSQKPISPVADISPTATPPAQQLELKQMPETTATVSAVIKTSTGDITIKLFPDIAPTTVKNFIGLSQGTKPWTNPQTGQSASTPLYNNTIFHRVISGFMVQGGGFEPGMKQKPTKDPVKNEADNGLKNELMKKGLDKVRIIRMPEFEK